MWACYSTLCITKWILWGWCTAAKWIVCFGWRRETSTESIVKCTKATGLWIIECGRKFSCWSKFIIRSVAETIRFVVEWITSWLLSNLYNQHAILEIFFLKEISIQKSTRRRDNGPNGTTVQPFHWDFVDLITASIRCCYENVSGNDSYLIRIENIKTNWAS